MANLLLGVNQGLTWTMTVTSKIDLVGSRRRGFALGINEFSGYAGVSMGGLLSGLLAGAYGVRVAPFLFVFAVVLVMLVAALFVRETLPYTRHTRLEMQASVLSDTQEHASARPGLWTIFVIAWCGEGGEQAGHA